MWRLVVALVLVHMPLSVLCSDVQACYTYGGVAGIVVATVVVTIVMGGLAAAAVWHLWRQKSTLSSDVKKKPGSTFFTSPAAMEKNCAGLDQKHPDKKTEGAKEAYAFDNPYFKDDEVDSRSKNQNDAEKGEAGFKTDNGDVRHAQETKSNSVSKGKKSRPFGNLQFPNVFHQGFKKTRAMDDTFIPKALERVEVPLRGHDFTGLGFNICGNMRDGIFVKDVLHRGPASESGKIKAGDRIIGVWVSFSGMVYEDALTILSYASPYDVRLELEKTVDAGKSLALPVSSPASKTRLASSSFRTGQRLFHPLYRSQSFDDLTQIGKENHLALNNNNGTAAVPASNNCSSCPKRSQSIEGATSPKPRIHQDPAKTRKSTSSSEASKKNSPATSKAGFSKEAHHVKKAAPSPAVKAPRVETQPLLKKAPEPASSLHRNLANEVPPTEKSEISSEELPKYEESTEGPPTVPPRKSGNHTKRKAPSPPKEPPEPSKTETSAIVHRDAEGEDVVEEGPFASDVVDNDLKDKKESPSKPGNYEEASDVQSLSGESSTPTLAESEDPESSPKRKASSLGDLTKLDSGRQKKKSAMASSPILERAVSLDLQQSLPEGNLAKQKLVLEDPTFEHPEDAMSCEDNLTRSNQEDGKSPNLTRWEGQLLKQDVSKTVDALMDKHQVGLWPDSGTVSVDVRTSTVANGHIDELTKDPEEPSFVTFKMPTEDQIKVTSTPIKKNLVTESFFKDSVDIDDVPYLGDQSSEITSDVSSSSPPQKSVGIPPISLSIPVIKPNFSQYEVLPSPEKSVNVYTPSVSGQENSTHEDQKPSQDIKIVESTYKPVFSISSYVDASLNSSQDSELSAIDIVNGNGLDASTSSYGQYKTASEESSLSTDSTLVKSAVEPKATKLPEITGIKVHGGAAGFAKTLIISSPIEGESISLNADLSTPPPTLEPPP